VAIAGGLSRGFAKSQIKIAVGQTSVTGTGAITSGLSVILAGGAHTTLQNGATTVPADGPSWVSSISGGTINAVVATLQAAANIISVAAKNLGWVAVGY